MEFGYLKGRVFSCSIAGARGKQPKLCSEYQRLVFGGWFLGAGFWGKSDSYWTKKVPMDRKPGKHQTGSGNQRILHPGNPAQTGAAPDANGGEDREQA
jgi:hypothetical protein